MAELFQVEIVVRLWKNGFTVNDEDLRSYTLEENQEFLEAIKRGWVVLIIVMVAILKHSHSTSRKGLKWPFYYHYCTFSPQMMTYRQNKIFRFGNNLKILYLKCAASGAWRKSRGWRTRSQCGGHERWSLCPKEKDLSPVYRPRLQTGKVADPLWFIVFWIGQSFTPDEKS